ncbi:Hypothetical protein SCF082_LOCUS28356 [Durusdinium trenchii]|uniref:Uncharacterized protein n=3 Tax=Durusdinium trenchii TaxID=1381693 RepID=A0ABP0MJP2_9DINO
MLLHCVHVLVLCLQLGAATDATCRQCEERPKAPSLLSLKSEVAMRSVQTSEGMIGDVIADFASDTSDNNTNASWEKVNQSLQDLVVNVMAADVNQTMGVPNPEGNHTDPQNRTGLGKLSQTLEFLYLKVAQLETAVELQNIEFKIAHEDAQKEIQHLKDRLDHKDAMLQQLNAKLKHHQSQSGHGKEELQEPEPVVANKHRQAWVQDATQRHQKHQKKMDEKAHRVLRDVLLKFHRQSHGKDWAPAPSPPPAPASRASRASASPSRPDSALLQRQGRSGREQELDNSVAAKVVDDIVDGAEDVGGAVVDGASSVVTSGTGLVGDALSDAYNAAADKVSFVANTVIDTVEQAVAILINGFDFSAGCPHWIWPSLQVSNSEITIGWGRQMCEVVLVGQRLTLFDFNWGTIAVPYPAPIAAMVAMGSNLVNCISGGGPAFDIFKCVAKTIGETLLQVVPPFSILTKLSAMLSEFLAFFAEMASGAISAAVGETTSMVQEAASSGKFPSSGEQPKLVSSRRGLSTHLRRHVHHQRVRKSSMMQVKEEPDDTMGSGAIGFATTEAMPYASMLITQFGGDEFDSGSCLAFAPKHRTGTGNTVTKRDWQVPSPDSTDFVKLEPWGVPCDNQWAKDNPTKWEGYSFYTYKTVIEKCVAVSYTMSAQPVLAFVGGLEFDLMPAPLAEVSTEVCWPDRVTAPDLSLIITTIRTAGIVLFKHTIRLHKRFGGHTSFDAGHIKDTIERARNYFGKGTSADDDKALQGLSRTALNQVANASNQRTSVNTTSTRRPTRSKDEFDPESEELYIASARYGKEGVKVTESFRGREAAELVRAAMKKASKNLTVLQEGEEGDEDTAMGNHKLWEIGSPAGALVGFSIIGQLAAGVMQMKVQMSFGPLDSPARTVDLLNLVDHLRVVLAAIPFVSQASKEKAIDALTTTNLESQIPQIDIKGALPLVNGWAPYGGWFGSPIYRLRDGVCSVQGVVAGTNWGHIATLPPECRPDQVLLFNANNHDSSARIDVLPDGRVNWVAGGHSYGWVSLSNLVFVPGSSGWPVPLVNGWASYGGDFGTPTYKLKGTLCVVDGLIHGGTWDHLATLPEECRPTKRLLFNMNNHERSTRVDVFPTGAISYVDGGNSHGWVSLAGIIFTTKSLQQQPLALASGWSLLTLPEWNLPITYSVAEGLCILEGLVSGTAWGHVITSLPVECWPMRTLIFGTNNGGDVIQRVDVDVEGNVKHISAGSALNSWISLAGIAFAQETSGVRLLPLRTSWVSWGQGFGEATFNTKNGMCMLEAIVLDGAAWTLFAQLPEGCRPTKQLIFAVNHHSYQHRVDVHPDGRITWVAGPQHFNWVSLSNIAFAPGTVGHITLPLHNGWSAYGGAYGSPDYTVRNGICSLEGLVFKSGGFFVQHIATLPEDCRPSAILVFNVDNHGATSRVDINRDGIVTWAAAGGHQEWVALSGIVFSPMSSGASAYPIPLASGWHNYGNGFADAAYHVVDGICTVEGLIYGGTWGHLATLPSDCRPSKVLIFSMNHHDSQLRVDVRANGEIHYIAGTVTYDWVSLSGILFETVQ